MIVKICDFPILSIVLLFQPRSSPQGLEGLLQDLGDILKFKAMENHTLTERPKNRGLVWFCCSFILLCGDIIQSPR